MQRIFSLRQSCFRIFLGGGITASHANSEFQIKEMLLLLPARIEEFDDILVYK